MRKGEGGRGKREGKKPGGEFGGTQRLWKGESNICVCKYVYMCVLVS